jgi:hypothetical protein
MHGQKAFDCIEIACNTAIRDSLLYCLDKTRNTYLEGLLNGLNKNMYTSGYKMPSLVTII